jgi:hypothetical protein
MAASDLERRGERQSLLLHAHEILSLSLSLSILFFCQQKDMWFLPSLPSVEDFLPTLQKRVPPEDERETHTRKREQRLYKPESSGFQKHPQQRFPDAIKEKKNQSTQQKFKPRILVF